MEIYITFMFYLDPNIEAVQWLRQDWHYLGYHGQDNAFNYRTYVPARTYDQFKVLDVILSMIPFRWDSGW